MERNLSWNFGIIRWEITSKPNSLLALPMERSCKINSLEYKSRGESVDLKACFELSPVRASNNNLFGEFQHLFDDTLFCLNMN